MKRFALLVGVLAYIVGEGSTIHAQFAGIFGGRGDDAITTEYIVVSGNGINPDFDNTGFPNIPENWGDTSLAIVIGSAPPNGAALRGRTHLNSRTGYIVRFDLYVATSSMAEGQFCSIAVGKEVNPGLSFEDPLVDIAYYVRLTKTSGQYKLAMHYPTATGEQSNTWSGVVNLNEVNTIYVEHNPAFSRTLFKVNTDTVVNVIHDGLSVGSIGTLVLGSSGGSTCRDTIYLIDRIIESPIPSSGGLPTGATVVSPANGATNVEVTQTFVCAGQNASTWEIAYGTANPPTSYIAVGAGGSLGPVSLLNNTVYYVRCRPSNSNGVGTASSVASFTTIATTSTGPHSALLITAGRQAIWAQMKGDFDGSATNPKCTDALYSTNQKIACSAYKSVYDKANQAPGTSQDNEGQEAALLANVAGNDAAAYCTKAYNHANATGILKINADEVALGYLNVNVHRELSTDWVLVYDWCYNDWTQTQRDAYLSRLNSLFTYIVNTQYPNGWLCGDVDQQIGNYYGLTMLYYATSSYNPTVVTLWADNDIGGITAGPLVCSPQAHLSNTARNQIAYYYSDATGASSVRGPNIGGLWYQGTEYSQEAYLGVLGCESLRTTAAGNAPCAEVDTWIDDWAAYSTHRFSRNYQAVYQFADNQEPHTAWLNYFRQHEAAHWMTLSGLMPNNAARGLMWRQFQNFFTVNTSAKVFPGVYPARAMMLANPYITAAADLTTLPKCYESVAAGAYTWNDSWTGVSSDASQFVFQFKRESRGNDHYIIWAGDFYLYRKGKFAITHPFSYGGNGGLSPEGINGVNLEGMEPSPGLLLTTKGPQYREVNGYVCGSDYMYVSGTTGGSFMPLIGFDNEAINPGSPPHYVDEYTRSAVYLSSVTKDYDTIYVIDRMAVKNPETLARFTNYVTTNAGTNQTCYNAGGCASAGYWYEPARRRIADYPSWSSYLYQWVRPPTAAPVVVGTNTTWTLTDGQLASDTWLTPDAVTVTLENMDNIGNGMFNSFQHTEIVKHHYRTTIEPTADADWTVAARVVTVRDFDAVAPVIVELSVTGTCLATQIKRTGENDVIIVSNSAQGDLISQENPTSAEATAVLATARYMKAKTCTIPWTQSTATAKVIILDMNPALGWTSNLDGAGAVAITEDASGLDELSIANTGAHSLVVIGS